MKHIALFTVSILFLASCSRRAEINTTPATPAANRILGNWNVNESEAGNVNQAALFPIAIKPADNSKANVTITNLHNYFKIPVSATVVGDSIYIPEQKVEGHTVLGAGYISPAGQRIVMTMSYKILDSSSALIASYGYNNTLPSVWK